MTGEEMAARQAERKKRVEQVKAAFLEGVRKHFPGAQHVEMHDDAIVDLYTLGVIDGDQMDFDRFLDSLRNPPEPEPIEDDDERMVRLGPKAIRHIEVGCKLEPGHDGPCEPS